MKGQLDLSCFVSYFSVRKKKPKLRYNALETTERNSGTFVEDTSIEET